MSSAYCLTCNEQVTEANGTCPHGHPVTSARTGPEPWVGYASTDVELGLAHLLDDRSARGDTQWREPDVAHLEQIAVGAAVTSGNGNSTNGHGGNGHVNGHDGTYDDWPPALAFEVEASSGVPRALADGQVSDDLAAMLADALAANGHTPVEPAAAAANDPAPSYQAPTHDPAPAFDPAPAADWAPTHDPAPAFDPAPAADWAPTHEPTPIFEPTQAHEPAPVPAPAPPAGAPEPVRATPAATGDWDDLASLAAELQLESRRAIPDPDVGDIPSASEPLDTVDLDLQADPDPVPSVPATPAPTTVDLSNFTARGVRVGEDPAATRKRRRKR